MPHGLLDLNTGINLHLTFKNSMILETGGNRMMFILLTLVPLNHKMDSRQLNGQQGRVPKRPDRSP
jgi:hypothetical protein